MRVLRLHGPPSAGLRSLAAQRKPSFLLPSAAGGLSAESLPRCTCEQRSAARHTMQGRVAVAQATARALAASFMRLRRARGAPRRLSLPQRQRADSGPRPRIAATPCGAAAAAAKLACAGEPAGSMVPAAAQRRGGSSCSAACWSEGQSAAMDERSSLALPAPYACFHFAPLCFRR
ncbi:hypothetical protein FA09DRAFT_44308 [Tilletiopsis washingtonensis]|uniref:Uncharacterized protein n=1 Tax=Tilletiopsis washingtonensis TaxID=58919 RepID=A0A316Z7Y5_9BASI|nr:hypothetical protein FA09DRAFT_44308 [Tilletiopsis washingtonensis]PWN97709.1 hypothetical protein FA09DRAFT_44308 [Tilletiopsis washingtonensis]